MANRFNIPNRSKPAFLQSLQALDGFTLTELMVAVGIIGILSAIALPNYANSVNRARQADAANQISQIQSTIQALIVIATHLSHNHGRVISTYREIAYIHDPNS